MTSILTERDFQRSVTDLAELLGWLWVHPRAGRTIDSWRTPMSGPLGQGWPDLVLIHPVRRRLLFVELKTDTGKLTAHQERVLELLRRLTIEPVEQAFAGPLARVEVHVWRPKDWSLIEATLRSSKEEAA